MKPAGSSHSSGILTREAIVASRGLPDFGWLAPGILRALDERDFGVPQRAFLAPLGILGLCLQRGAEVSDRGLPVARRFGSEGIEPPAFKRFGSIAGASIGATAVSAAAVSTLDSWACYREKCGS
ncbi:MAG: hypothetical protein M3Y09_01810 [Actinomycetota bacterium]|nr:hypothetical protein [Actinomycetota bacterium]